MALKLANTTRWLGRLDTSQGVQVEAGEEVQGLGRGAVAGECGEGER